MSAPKVVILSSRQFLQKTLAFFVDISENEVTFEFHCTASRYLCKCDTLRQWFVFIELLYHLQFSLKN